MSHQSGKLSIFVVMTFDARFVDVYELGIKPACIEAGATCERVDEQLFLENILERIYGEIQEADLIVAEMTGKTANVFYEVGYAHGMGKPVILLTRAAEDIPFDLKHYPHIVYGESIANLKKQLHQKIKWCVEHPDKMIGPRGNRQDDSDLDLVSRQIESYLTAQNFTKMSFERIAAVMNYPEERVRAVIQKSPRKFRFALLKGNLPGIALLK